MTNEQPAEPQDNHGTINTGWDISEPDPERRYTTDGHLVEGRSRQVADRMDRLLG
jgi:hypothetical protein